MMALTREAIFNKKSGNGEASEVLLFRGRKNPEKITKKMVKKRQKTSLNLANFVGQSSQELLANAVATPSQNHQKSAEKIGNFVVKPIKNTQLARRAPQSHVW
jgi:hypothetical protein